MPNSSSPLPSPCGLFASRDTLAEALEYSTSLIEARIPLESRAYAFTALWVTANTAIKELERKQLPPFDLASTPVVSEEALREACPQIAQMEQAQCLQYLRMKLPTYILLAKAMESENHPGHSELGYLSAVLMGLFELTPKQAADEAVKHLHEITSKLSSRR